LTKVTIMPKVTPLDRRTRSGLPTTSKELDRKVDHQEFPMKKCITALAVAAAVFLLAQDAQAFGKRKCNTCQTVSTCQPAPTSCQTVVTVHANPPTVVYAAPTTVHFQPTTVWQTVNWPSTCPNGRCPTVNR
jgi:uncharacterized membrane protein